MAIKIKTFRIITTGLAIGGVLFGFFTVLSLYNAGFSNAFSRVDIFKIFDLPSPAAGGFLTLTGIALVAALACLILMKRAQSELTALSEPNVSITAVTSARFKGPLGQLFEYGGIFFGDYTGQKPLVSKHFDNAYAFKWHNVKGAFVYSNVFAPHYLLLPPDVDSINGLEVNEQDCFSINLNSADGRWPFTFQIPKVHQRYFENMGVDFARLDCQYFFHKEQQRFVEFKKEAMPVHDQTAAVHDASVQSTESQHAREARIFLGMGPSGFISPPSNFSTFLTCEKFSRDDSPIELRVFRLSDMRSNTGFRDWCVLSFVGEQITQDQIDPNRVICAGLANSADGDQVFRVWVPESQKNKFEEIGLTFEEGMNYSFDGKKFMPWDTRSECSPPTPLF